MMSFRWDEYLFQVTNVRPGKDEDELIAALCPTCGKEGHNLWKVSVRLDWGTYHCYRCDGWFSPRTVIHAYEGLTGADLRRRVKEFTEGGRPAYSSLREAMEALSIEQVEVNTDSQIEAIRPPRTRPLDKNARHYLRKRGFGVDVIDHFGLRICLENGIMLGRIFIPVYESNNLIGYQGRTMKGKNPKYYSPPNNNLKHTFYNIDNLVPGWVTLVEGVTSAWATWLHDDPNVIASFGKNISSRQISILSKTEEIFGVNFLFDAETQAVKSALKAARAIHSAKPVRIAFLEEGDPADKPEKIGKALDEAEDYSPHKELRFLRKYHVTKKP